MSLRATYTVTMASCPDELTNEDLGMSKAVFPDLKSGESLGLHLA